VLGPRGAERLVTTTLAPRGRGDRERPRRREGDEGGRREGRDRRDGREGAGRRPREGAERRGRPAGERRPPLEAKPKPKRLRPGRTHRRELVAALPEEQRPIAEELSRGGIPGVRAALETQSAQAKAEGHPEINPAPLLALAEELWPRMRTAEWRDRAEAAIKEVDELDLRDLRSVVVAADSAARDDDSRAMAAQLRDALTRRVDEEHLKWLTELAELVADNRVVAALRRSSRPPKAGAPLPSDLARLLIDRTSESLSSEVTADRWSVLLDALSFSPVRSSVTPVSVPEQPNEELLTAVRKSAGRLPHIAALFGIEVAAGATMPKPIRPGRPAAPARKQAPANPKPKAERPPWADGSCGATRRRPPTAGRAGRARRPP
jgi:hypothetical protein